MGTHSQTSKMLQLLPLAGLMAALSQGIPMQSPECCDSKGVGGVSYSLVGQMDTTAYQCLNNCVYVKDQDPTVKFCFASGDLQVECTEDEFQGSDKPPTEAPAGEVTTTTSTNSSAGCKCGIKRTSRIVGGTETEINEYPWMAAITDSQESQFCGGTLIASQWILTAAHCMFKDSAGTQPQTAAEIRIVLGEHDLLDSFESKIPKKVAKVSQIINHPSYSALTSNNDIALLKLSEEVDLNVYTPSCVANTGDTFEGQKAWVYGWGTTSSGGESSYKLLEVEVPVVSNAVCTTALQTEITDDMLCAGGELNKDGCQGDSGGPLTVEVRGKHVLIGDVSWGNGCGLEGQYGVYGDVAYFRTWVDSSVSGNGGAKYCPA